MDQGLASGACGLAFEPRINTVSRKRRVKITLPRES